MSSFEKWFSQSTKKFDQVLLRLAVSFLAILFLSQMIMANSTLRNFFNHVERLEGEEIAIEQIKETLATKDFENIDIHHLEFTLDGNPEPELEILVNNEVRGSFKNNKVLLEVEAGDLIEIDGESVKKNITVKVTSTGSMIKTPPVGYTVTTYGTNELVGWITINKD